MSAIWKGEGDGAPASWKGAPCGEDARYSAGAFYGGPAPVWREHPRYDFLVEIADLPDEAQARRFLEELDRELAALNFPLAGSPEGDVDAARRIWCVCRRGTWARYVRAETDRRGTGDYQYKHPGLVQDGNWGEAVHGGRCHSGVNSHVTSITGSRGTLVGSAEGQRPFARRRPDSSRDTGRSACPAADNVSYAPSPTRGDCKASSVF